MKSSNFTHHVNWQKVMRISLIQFITSLLIMSFSYAHSTKAQAILDKEVSVRLVNVPLKEVIQRIQDQTQVKFVYSSRINLKTGVSINADKLKLSVVLERLFASTQIGYRVINNQIVLTAEKNQTQLYDQPSDSPAVASEQQVQAFIIKGIVTDEKGQKIPGVNISIKGTNLGATTNENGEYSLNVPNEKAVLVFSFVGYLNQEVMLNGKTTVDVSLQIDNKTLNEVVVVAYNTTKKANLTGAVSSIKMNDIDGLPLSNAATALQGRMAGVTVSSFSGQPGRNDPQIRIRGVGTFGNNSPLVIIDGVPNEVSALGDISVDDIENVSVLKDAASASIYGVRAANGVILVNTKRGVAGKAKIQYRATYSVQKPLIKPRYMDALQWTTAYNDFLRETGAAPAYTDAMLQKIKDQSDPDNFANVDWFDEVYKPAPLNMQFLSASGGTEASKYLVSLEYLDQKGIMDNTNSKRIQIRANFDGKITNNLSFGVNLRGLKQGIKEPIAAANQNDEGDNGINRVISGFLMPTVPVRYSFGEFALFDGVNLTQIKNPIKLLYEQKNNTDNYRLDGKAFVQAKFLKNFNFTSSLGYVYSSTLNYRFSPSVFTFRADGSLFNNAPSVSSTSNSSSIFTRFLVENLLRYENVFNGKHDIKLLVGQTAQRDETKSFNASIRNLPSNDVVVLGASSELPSNGGSASALSLQSFLGRINYSFKDKYLVELNARMDGTSRLPESQQYPIFPSASAGWIISNEPFMKSLAVIDFLKLRASWGILGNQEIGNYSFTQNYALNQNYLFNNALTQGVAINSLANSMIQWETTTQSNIGLDLELLNRKIRVEADVFDKNTSNILVQLPIPNTLGGLGAPNQNAGIVNNRGVELLINHTNRIGKLEYDISVNGAMIKNTIKSTAGRVNWISGNTINQVGSPINSYFGYVSNGLFRTQDQIGTSAKQFGNTPRIGDVNYQDTDGNGDVTTADRVIIGNPFPKLTFGFSLGLKYAGFDVSSFFQGVSGIQRYYEDNANMGARGQKLAIWNDLRWTVNNPDGTLPRWGNPTNNNAYSSFRLQDASYLRLKNLEVGYTIPRKLLSPIGMTNLRVYFNGINLLTFAQNRDYDVEKSDNDARSLDYLNTKTVSFGLSATF